MTGHCCTSRPTPLCLFQQPLGSHHAAAVPHSQLSSLVFLLWGKTVRGQVKWTECKGTVTYTWWARLWGVLESNRIEWCRIEYVCRRGTPRRVHLRWQRVSGPADGQLRGASHPASQAIAVPQIVQTKLPDRGLPLRLSLVVSWNPPGTRVCPVRSEPRAIVSYATHKRTANTVGL